LALICAAAEANRFLFLFVIFPLVFALHFDRFIYFFPFFVSLAAVGSFLNSNNHGDYLKFGWANSMHRYFARTHKRPSRPFSLAHSWSEENAHLTVCLKFCFKIRSNSSNCTEIGFFPATLTVTDVFQTFFNGTRENTCSTNRGWKSNNKNRKRAL